MANRNRPEPVAYREARLRLRKIYGSDISVWIRPTRPRGYDVTIYLGPRRIVGVWAGTLAEAVNDLATDPNLA